MAMTQQGCNSRQFRASFLILYIKQLHNLSRIYLSQLCFKSFFKVTFLLWLLNKTGMNHNAARDFSRGS